MVSSSDEGVPSSATEMAIGGISTESSRSWGSPVTQMLEPPSISGHELSVGTTVIVESSVLEIPYTRGDPTIWVTLAVDKPWDKLAESSLLGANVVRRTCGRKREWDSEPRGKSVGHVVGGGSGGGRTVRLG